MKANFSFKSFLFVAAITCTALQANAQVKVGDNPTTITSSAVLDVESTNKGVIFPRVTLTSTTDQTTIPSPATGLLVYHKGNSSLSAGYYYWDGSKWSTLGNNASTTDFSSELVIGYRRTFTCTMPTSAANGTVLSTLYPTQLPIVDGFRIDLAKSDNTYYRPRIYNVSNPAQLISYQTFATQVNENKTELNAAVPYNSYVGVDNNDIVYWTQSAAEVETSNVQVQVSNGVWRWYEFQWWAMETPSSGVKTIFLSILRKG